METAVAIRAEYVQVLVDSYQRSARPRHGSWQFQQLKLRGRRIQSTLEHASIVTFAPVRRKMNLLDSVPRCHDHGFSLPSPPWIAFDPMRRCGYGRTIAVVLQVGDNDPGNDTSVCGDIVDKPFILYGRPGTGSLAVQIALEEMGLSYERVWVGSEPADVDRFRDINPTGKVPALRLPDGTVMFESAAILMHLGLLGAPTELAPQSGTTRHALFLQSMIFLSETVYSAALRLFYSSRYSSRGEADAPAIAARARMEYATHLEFIGRTLAPYVLGADYTLADPYLYMLASWLPEKDELFARVPRLAAHAENVSGRPAVKKVEADHAKHA
jgi:glutathione S-transferase